MTKYPMTKETTSPKPECPPVPCSGLGVSGFFRVWVFRHSSFCATSGQPAGLPVESLWVERCAKTLDFIVMDELRELRVLIPPRPWRDL